MSALTGIERVFEWLIQTTWQAAVLAAIILLVQRLLRHRLSPAWRHGLWLLLVARLLMPVAPGSAISIFNLAKWPHHQIAPAASIHPSLAQAPAMTASLAPATVSFQQRASPLPASPGSASPAAFQAAPLAPGSAAGTPVLTEPTPTKSAPSGPPLAAASAANSVDWLGLATLAWFAGALIFGLRFAWSSQRFTRRLARYVPVSDVLVRRLCGECAESLGVRARLVVVETEEVEGPAVYGLWRKRLLLPGRLRGQLSPDELRHVLLHEFAHVKRRDPELNLLMDVLRILHWFNPVLWFAFARMRADREMATDDLVLTQGRQLDRACYGETILKVLETLTQPRALPGLVGIGESKAQLKERIRAIARGDTGARWRWMAGVVAVVIAGICLTSAREDNPRSNRGDTAGQPPEMAREQAPARVTGIDLLKKYPTTLAGGDAAPDRARPWTFTASDVFQLSRFDLQIGKKFRVQAGPSDLGIGHCDDGAVWAVILPRTKGTLTSSVTTNQEPIANVWLRFHPSKLDLVFPPQTVLGPGLPNLEQQMRVVADAKFHSSWHAGNNAMIPPPKDITVDVDTKGGPRRVFMVDTAAQTAQYAAAFVARGVRAAAEPAYVPEVDPNRARVVAVSPANGANDVALEQDLRVRFDRPMNPYYVKLEWIAGGFQLNGSIRVSPDHTEFTVPVRLKPGQEQTIAVNRDWQRDMWLRFGKPMGQRPPPPPHSGFLDAKSVPANEFRWSFTTKELAVKPGAKRPKLVSASPASGSTTPVLTFVELTFDQPMRPPDVTFPCLRKAKFGMGGPSLIPSFDYNPALHRFTIPVVLRVNDDTRVTLEGLYSAEGVAADPIVLHYRTGNQPIDPKYLVRAKAAAKNPKLVALLTAMKRARSRLNSAVEKVQSVNLGLSDGSFKSIDTDTATFKWRGSNQFYADISGPMLTPGAFILGDDGRDCWLYTANEKGETTIDRIPSAAAQKTIVLLDPFDLTHRSVSEALADGRLVLASDAILEGHPCYRIEEWEVNIMPYFVAAGQAQWWIDKKTLLPRQCTGNGSFVRFDWTDLNRHLAESDFEPPAPATEHAKPAVFTKPLAPGDQPFLQISDGTDGRMSGRLGWTNAKGRFSSGLN
jgi:beta-lactamase regulating signal transducer with metallopeptidase domain